MNSQANVLRHTVKSGEGLISYDLPRSISLPRI